MDSSGQKAAAVSPRDLIQRGNIRTNVPGILTFIGLRALDPLLQYKLIAGGWGAALLSKIGVATIAPGAALSTGFAAVDALVLSLPQLVVLSMSVGAVLKQVYWLTIINRENFPPLLAMTVSVYNNFVNCINSLLLVAAATSAVSAPAIPGTDVPYPIALGLLLYSTGIFLETQSERQRKAFKENPRSQGKVMRRGLWSVARHINYGGYSLWRGGYTTACSGAVGGFLFFAFYVFNLINGSVPSLDAYCAKRYGEQWAAFKRDVKWVLLPGIY
jgi:protein-S-isoprenylcysteine O-methyltransferase Ste14